MMWGSFLWGVCRVENPCWKSLFKSFLWGVCGEYVVLKILVGNPCWKYLFMSSTQRTPHAPSCKGERGGRDPVFGLLAARSLRDRGFSGFGPQGARDAGKTHNEASKVSCKAHASFCARLEPSCKKSEYFERVLAFGPWP